MFSLEKKYEKELLCDYTFCAIKKKCMLQGEKCIQIYTAGTAHGMFYAEVVSYPQSFW